MANKTYQITAVILLAAAAYVTFAALNMRFYTSLGPGPGFFPMFMAGILALLAFLLLIEATARSGNLPEAPFGDTSPIRIWQIVAIIGAIIAFAALMVPLGYPVTTMLFVLLMLRIFGMKSWYSTVGTALAFGLGSYYAFTSLLRVPLPGGIWPN